MELDTNETFICENQIELTPLEPRLDVLLGGSNAVYVTVLPNFNPHNLQGIMAELKERLS